MKNNYPTYDPNDIESLLHHKAFDELSSSEQDFVLSLVESKEEYERMRNTIVNIEKTFSFEDVIEPEDYVKTQLLDRFKQQHQHKSTLWSRIGQTLFPSGKNILLSPGFQLAGLALIFAVTVIWYQQSGNIGNTELAQHKSSAKDEYDLVSKDTTSNTEILQPTAPLEDEKLMESPAIAEESVKDNRVTSGESVELKPNGLISNAKIAEAEIDRMEVNQNSVIEEKSLAKTINVAREETVTANDDFVSTENISDVSTSTERGKSSKKSKDATPGKNDKAKETVGYETYSSGSSTKDNFASDKEQKGTNAGKNPELLELLFTAL